ncbi:hypothetical protein EB232_31975 [Mesorhizobium sp. NZP2077]|nr:hypothetical protein EB232_31975 [Mesorhizobium sp. NZP2077]
MARYFFDIHDGTELTNDDDGIVDDAGRYAFRATSTFASAWIVETIDGVHQPGGDRWTTTLSRARTQVTALRKEFAEDGYSQRLEALDSLFSVAQSQVNCLLATRAPHEVYSVSLRRGSSCTIARQDASLS